MATQTFNLLGGFKIPAVGLGTLAATDEAVFENTLDLALEIGYRHIDTAYLYGNEAIIGKVLKKWFKSGKLKREDIFITTKLPGCVEPERVEGFLKKSLEQLQLDYVDLYLIHFPINCTGASITTWEALPTDHVATWKKLEEQVDLGRTKTIGVSNFNIKQIERIIEFARIKPASNQVELHVYLQQPELVKYCKDNGIIVVSYQTLGNPNYNVMAVKQGRAPRKLANVLGDPIVKKIADKYKKTPAQILLKYFIQNGIAVIPKSVTPLRIRENFDLFNFTLDEDDVNVLKGLDKGEEERCSSLAFNSSFANHPEYPYPRRA